MSKKIIIFMILMFAFAAQANAADWFVYMKNENKCSVINNYNNPAKYIEGLRILQHKYKVEDTTVNGNITKVQIDDLSTYVSVTYYKTKEICESEMMAKKRKDKAELDKYR